MKIIKGFTEGHKEYTKADKAEGKAYGAGRQVTNRQRFINRLAVGEARVQSHVGRQYFLIASSMVPFSWPLLNEQMCPSGSCLLSEHRVSTHPFYHHQ